MIGQIILALLIWIAYGVTGWLWYRIGYGRGLKDGQIIKSMGGAIDLQGGHRDKRIKGITKEAT